MDANQSTVLLIYTYKYLKIMKIIRFVDMCSMMDSVDLTVDSKEIQR